MNLFLGRMSIRTDLNDDRYDNKYYDAGNDIQANPRQQNWLNGLSVNDYVLMSVSFKIENDKQKTVDSKPRVLELWKVTKIEGTSTYFEQITSDLGIVLHKIASLKILKITKATTNLAMKSSNSSAFWKLELTKNINSLIDEIKDPNYYTNDSNFRKIVFLENISLVDENSEDIQLYHDNGKIKLFPSTFIADDILEKFKDQTEYLDKNDIERKKQKDIWLQKIKNGNFYDISVPQLYDAMFTEYNSKTDKLSDDAVNDEDSDTAEKEPEMPKPNQSLNQILYGPPGTGKTYHTINKAVEIIDGKVPEDRESTKKRFDELKDAGQIVFTTFHQSFGYEEFVEGIKASTADKGIEYSTEDGIFKKLCAKSQERIYTIGNTLANSNASVWKISLGGSGENHQVKKDCFTNGLIRIGWENVTEIGDVEFEKLGSKEKNTLENFLSEMQVGDFVLSLGNQKEADGVGIIVGDYERDDYEHYPHKRKVEWLAKDNKFPVYELNGNKNLVQQTVYKLHRFNADQIIKLLGQNLVIDDDCSNKNYILIIDEINRGNISKIFGELITLIEPSKRIGGDEEIRLTLPYSGHTFGVPKNLYIIGTMNTADRSIALMDTALRRRFEFTEMMPDLEIVGELDSIDGINIRLLLEKINQRIEYLYDRDHQIGHAYFMSLIDKSGAEAKKELDNIFRNKIIPLLQEYFYDDWEKIQMVLGDHPDQNAEDVDKFIKSNKVEEKRLFGFDHEEVEDEQIIYTINKNFTDLAYTKISEFQKTNAN